MAADLLAMIIEFLRINCSTVNCYTGQPLEAVFYLVFFPSVFIILFIYILSNFIVKGGKTGPRGLRILIAITIYMFIVIGGWYSIFVMVSKIWWIVIILLFGFWIFVVHIAGGGESGKGAMPPVGRRGLLGHISTKFREKVGRNAIKYLKLESAKDRVQRRAIEQTEQIIAKRLAGGKLDEEEQTIYLGALGVTVREGEDIERALKRADKKVSKDSE